MATRYRYQVEVRHQGLNKFRIVKGATRYEAELKANALMAQWDAQWQNKVEREERIKNHEDSASYADEITQQAEETQKALDEILLDNLFPKKLNIRKLKDFSEYQEPQPERPELDDLPDEPNPTDQKYNPAPSLFTKLSKKKMADFLKEKEVRFKKYHDEWMKLKDEVNSNNINKLQEYNTSLMEWEIRKADFERVQAEKNKEIDTFYKKYKSGDPESIELYFMLVIEEIELPFSYSGAVEIEYDKDRKCLIVDFRFPTVEDLPKLKSVSYIKTKQEFKDTYHTDSYMKKKYENVIYQIVLLLVNCIFKLSSSYSIIDVVVINGKVNTIDKSTGNRIEPYILSLNVTREAFEIVNLSAVDPKSWFKSAKGVSAASLSNITPIAPIVNLSKTDKRFVEGYNVSDSINESVNLAAMDWQDFENLIREIFQKEFSSNGGEVKITQASRDGGVDAIAFDPDPIRGGKIVIQAKRYTNTVGVSAVRDLYGTVMNEGATKGILVTTSNYGNDAFDFALGKPITLLSGANLLYLLEQHGYKARIDLKEAKSIQKSDASQKSINEQS